MSWALLIICTLLLLVQVFVISALSLINARLVQQAEWLAKHVMQPGAKENDTYT